MYKLVLILLYSPFIVNCSVSTTEAVLTKNAPDKKHLEARNLCQDNKLCHERLNSFISDHLRTPATDAEVCFVYSNIKSDYCHVE